MNMLVKKCTKSNSTVIKINLLHITCLKNGFKYAVDHYVFQNGVLTNIVSNLQNFPTKCGD